VPNDRVGPLALDIRRASHRTGPAVRVGSPERGPTLSVPEVLRGYLASTTAHLSAVFFSFAYDRASPFAPLNEPVTMTLSFAAVS